MNHLASIAGVVALLFVATNSSAQDLSSPRATLRTLEAAYTSKNMDTVVAAHDFHVEAEVMLERLAVQKKWHSPPDAELIAKTAEVLELSFRKEIKARGFPNFNELKCAVAEENPVQEGIVMLLEKCRYPDGQDSTQKLYFAFRDEKWRIFNVPTK